MSSVAWKCMDSGKHAGSFSFACEKVISAPQEQMGGGAGGGWRGAVGEGVDFQVDLDGFTW